MKIKKSGVKEESSKMNPHKTRREKLPVAAKGVAKNMKSKGKKVKAY